MLSVLAEIYVHTTAASRRVVENWHRKGAWHAVRMEGVHVPYIFVLCTVRIGAAEKAAPRENQCRVLRVTPRFAAWVTQSNSTSLPVCIPAVLDVGKPLSYSARSTTAFQSTLRPRLDCLLRIPFLCDQTGRRLLTSVFLVCASRIDDNGTTPSSEEGLCWLSSGAVLGTRYRAKQVENPN